MKDEEMADKHAEEYRKTFRYYRAWHGQVVDKSPSTIVEQSFKDGFLAGLKAGRPQWHDLEKDPTDLPKDDMSEVAIITPLGKWEKGIFRRVDCKCYWRIIGFNENVKVIAWCEIPTFDKE